VVEALLVQIADPIASFSADGDYDQDRASPAAEREDVCCPVEPEDDTAARQRSDGDARPARKARYPF
jgi:hypothetical protein